MGRVSNTVQQGSTAYSVRTVCVSGRHRKVTFRPYRREEIIASQKFQVGYGKITFLAVCWKTEWKAGFCVACAQVVRGRIDQTQFCV